MKCLKKVKMKMNEIMKGIFNEMYKWRTQGCIARNVKRKRKEDGEVDETKWNVTKGNVEKRKRLLK